MLPQLILFEPLVLGTMTASEFKEMFFMVGVEEKAQDVTEIANRLFPTGCTDDLLELVQLTRGQHAHSVITMAHLTSTWCHELSVQCQCISTSILTANDKHCVVLHCLRELLLVPDCAMVLLAHEYKILHRSYPDEQCLLQMLQNSEQMNTDPEGFSAAHKVAISTPNLDMMPTTTAPVGAQCALCQEIIANKLTVYQMPCCMNYFHKDKSDCLGTHGLFDWLSESKKCMVCNRDVVLPKDPMPKKNRRSKRRRV